MPRNFDSYRGFPTGRKTGRDDKSFFTARRQPTLEGQAKVKATKTGIVVGVSFEHQFNGKTYIVVRITGGRLSVRDVKTGKIEEVGLGVVGNVIPK
jgi:hypothetical protein